MQIVFEPQGSNLAHSAVQVDGPILIELISGGYYALTLCFSAKNYSTPNEARRLAAQEENDDDEDDNNQSSSIFDHEEEGYVFSDSTDMS